MTGLLLKDLINLKAQAKILGLFIIIYVVMGAMLDDASFLVGFITVILMILPITALSYDERAKWDKYALTMPVSRGTMVLEKYVLALVMCVIALAIDLIAVLLTSGDKGEMLPYVIIMSLAAIIMVSVVLPFIYKFGVEKARIIMIIIVCAPIAASSVVMNVIEKGVEMPGFLMKLSEAETSLPLMVVAIIVFSTAVLLISFVTSLKIYINKEF